jgi:hypothetical protein
MKEFFQAVLISVALTFPVFWMSNGFALSPKATAMPAMDMSMPGMNQGTGAATMPPVDESVPHAH